MNVGNEESNKPVWLCVAVRSRSLLFYNEEAPLEESLVPSEAERLESEGHSHIQAGRYTADAHSNHTAGPKLDRRYKKKNSTNTVIFTHCVSH